MGEQFTFKGRTLDEVRAQRLADIVSGREKLKPSAEYADRVVNKIARIRRTALAMEQLRQWQIAEHGWPINIEHGPFGMTDIITLYDAYQESKEATKQ